MNQRAKRRKNTFAKRGPDIWVHLFFGYSIFSFIVLPLIYSSTAMDITLMPRLLGWVVFLLILSLFFYSRQLYKELDFSIFKLALFPVLFVFFLFGVISMFFAGNFKAGFYDLVKTFSFILFLGYSCFIFLKTPDFYKRLTQFFIVATIVASTIGFTQYITRLGLGFHSRNDLGGLTGYMSNINLFAGYIMLLIPFNLLGLFIYKGLWRRLAIFALFAGVFLIIILQTRAVYLGLLTGLVGSVILFLIYRKQFDVSKATRRLMAIAFIVSLVIATGGFAVLPRDHVVKSRFLSIFQDTDNPRVLIWETSLRLIADNPVLGVGAGNFHLKMPAYAGEKGLDQEQINWMRPHNDFIWVASEKGIIGLLAFLAVFLIAMYYVRKVIFSKEDHHKKLLSLAVFSGLLAYMTFSFFDFPLERVNHLVLLAIYLATIISLVHTLHEKKPGMTNPLDRKLLMPVMVFLFFGIIFASKSIQLEKQVGIAREAHDRAQFAIMLQAAKDANNWWRTFDPMGNPVQMYECLAYMGLSNIPMALQTGEEARRLAPHKRTTLMPLGYIYLSLGQYEEAISCMQEVLRMYPNDVVSATILGGAYHQTGENTLALKVLEKIPADQRLPQSTELINTIRNELDLP